MVKKTSIIGLIPLFLLAMVAIFSFTGVPSLFFDKNRATKRSVVQANVKGLSILVVSPVGWELSEYVCKEAEECQRSPSSGKHISTIIGGEELEEEVVITYTEAWKDYEQVKIYVRPISSSPIDSFSIDDQRVFTHAKVGKTSDNDEIETLIIPTAQIKDGYYELAAIFKAN